MSALARSNTDTIVSKLHQARTALAEAKTLSETKEILDVAAAAELYAKRQQLGEEAEQYAYSVKMAAKIKLGEILVKTPKNEGTRGQLIGRGVIGSDFVEPPISTPTLGDLGIDKKLSSQAQKLAKLDEATKQAVIAGQIRQVEALRQVRKADNIAKAAALPAGKFRVILADPPWRYNDTRGMCGYERSAAEDYYPTMSLQELCDLDVGGLAADDSVLFCWATAPMLPEALEVIKAWGFTYKTFIAWDKRAGAFGNYHNGRLEPLLLATRGSCLPDADKREDQLQVWPRGRHSAKPLEIQAMIDRMYPHGPRIELFCRGAPPGGWAAWGNEADIGHQISKGIEHGKRAYHQDLQPASGD
jgi:N6-adenosine-specific RNA methylase IME4